MLLFLLASLARRFAAPTTEEMVGTLQTIDDRQTNNGDYTSLVFIEQKDPERPTSCTRPWCTAATPTTSS
jgi:hypothetical protein